MAMNVRSRLLSIGILLSCLIILQACGKQSPTETSGASQDPSSSTPVVNPAGGNYASDKEGWLVNLEEAYAQSERENKPILAYFTGSDWNGWCKRLDTDVFSTPTFKSWAAKNVVLLEVDFPKRKRLPQKNIDQNAAMAKSLNVTEYPTAWILKVDREVENGRFKVSPAGKTGYAKTPEEFIGALQQVMSR